MRLFKHPLTMGESGMADMGEMGMPVSRNSIPMVGEEGKHDYIDMRGLFTIVRVRENLASYDDPGWYENPPGTLASLASNDESQRDLGVVPSSEKSEKPIDNMNMQDGEHGHGA
jgi:manganese oxidase